MLSREDIILLLCSHHASKRTPTRCDRDCKGIVSSLHWMCLVSKPSLLVTFYVKLPRYWQCSVWWTCHICYSSYHLCKLTKCTGRSWLRQDLWSAACCLSRTAMSSGVCFSWQGNMRATFEEDDLAWQLASCLHWNLCCQSLEGSLPGELLPLMLVVMVCKDWFLIF